MNSLRERPFLNVQKAFKRFLRSPKKVYMSIHPVYHIWSLQAKSDRKTCMFSPISWFSVEVVDIKD